MNKRAAKRVKIDDNVLFSELANLLKLFCEIRISARGKVSELNQEDVPLCFN
jgi:hypothetical protein